MTHDKDKILLRAKDLGLLILVGTVLTMILGPLKRVYQWNEAVDRVSKLEERVSAEEKNIAVTQAEFDQIQKQLEQINWQLRRLNR